MPKRKRDSDDHQTSSRVSKAKREEMTRTLTVFVGGEPTAPTEGEWKTMKQYGFFSCRLAPFLIFCLKKCNYAFILLGKDDEGGQTDFTVGK